MKWTTDMSKVRVGYDVLIRLKDKQYIAGTFQRRGDIVAFISSDGAWRIELDDIDKFCEIS